MGKYNNVAKEGGRGFTLVEALTVWGIGVGGGVGSYRDDSSTGLGASIFTRNKKELPKHGVF